MLQALPCAGPGRIRSSLSSQAPTFYLSLHFLTHFLSKYFLCVPSAMPGLQHARCTTLVCPQGPQAPCALCQTVALPAYCLRLWHSYTANCPSLCLLLSWLLASVLVSCFAEKMGTSWLVGHQSPQWKDQGLGYNRGVRVRFGLREVSRH